MEQNNEVDLQDLRLRVILPNITVPYNTFLSLHIKKPEELGFLKLRKQPFAGEFDLTSNEVAAQVLPIDLSMLMGEYLESGLKKLREAASGRSMRRARRSAEYPLALYELTGDTEHFYIIQRCYRK